MRNLFKVYFRILIRNKLYTGINLLGIAIGTFACLMIMEYVSFERSYDQFHINKGKLLRVTRKYISPEEVRQFANNVPALGPLLKSEFPEVGAYTRLIPPEKLMSSFALSYHEDNGNVITFNEKRAFYVDNDFLSMFSYEWLQGNRETALERPNTVVLTKETSRKYFHDENPIGKTLLLNGDEAYTVTGIIDNVPVNSHIQFDVLCSFETLWDDLDENWGWGNFYTYILTGDEMRVDDLESKVNDFLYTHLDQSDEETVFAISMQPVEDIHLTSDLNFELSANGNKNIVDLLFVVGFFILVIAWMNYINLTTAKSIERAREVAIRKIMGSGKAMIMGQFLFEAILINSLAFLLSMTVYETIQPQLSELTGISFTQMVLDETSLITFSGIYVIGTLVSGLYPGILLSGIKTSSVLKGVFSHSEGGVRLRKVLVTFQFVISILFVSGTIIVYQQINYMRSQDLGFNPEQNLVLRKPAIKDSLYYSQFEYFRNKASSMSQVETVSSSSQVPGYELTRARWVHKFGGDPEMGAYPKVISIDENYLNSLDISFIAGRGFTGNYPFANQFIINRELANQLDIVNYDEAIGTFYTFENKKFELVGIIESYNQEFLKKTVEPHFYYVNEDINQYIIVKLRIAGAPDDIITQLESTYKEAFPNNHFDYFFLDDFYNAQYSRDQVFGKVFSLFAVLAILIAGLGLIGLTAFIIMQRLREISIRKVLGAKQIQIILNITNSYLWLIILAGLVSSPMIYLIFENWLSTYATRIDLSIWMILVPLVLIGVITITIIGLQTKLATRGSLSEKLRYE